MDGETAGDRFGTEILLLRDLDRDGFAEIAVTAKEKVYIFSGRDFALMSRLEGDPGAENFAFAAAANRFDASDAKLPYLFVGAPELRIGETGLFGVVYGYGGPPPPLEEGHPALPIHFNQ
jgi:hypothetical protein